MKIMIVSVSWLVSSPVAYFLRSSSESFCLLSEPTINQLVPREVAVLDAGSASVRPSAKST